jgi:hypothetical protein
MRADDIMGYAYQSGAYTEGGLRELLIWQGVSPVVLADIPWFLRREENAIVEELHGDEAGVISDPLHQPQPIYRGALEALERMGHTLPLKDADDVLKDRRATYALEDFNRERSHALALV